MRNKFLASVVAVLFSSSALGANAWINAPVGKVLVHDNGSSNFGGEVHVKMNSDMSWIPSCVTNDAYKKYFVIDLSRSAANAQYSMLLSAQVANKTITVQLNGVCKGGMALIRNINIGD